MSQKGERSELEPLKTRCCRDCLYQPSSCSHLEVLLNRLRSAASRSSSAELVFECYISTPTWLGFHTWGRAQIFAIRWLWLSGNWAMLWSRVFLKDDEKYVTVQCVKLNEENGCRCGVDESVYTSVSIWLLSVAFWVLHKCRDSLCF